MLFAGLTYLLLGEFTLQSVFLLIAGILAYELRGTDFCRRLIDYLGEAGASALLLLALFAVPMYLPGAPARAALSTLGVLVFFLSRFRREGRLNALLASAPFRWLGRVSYSYYLSHGISLYAAARLARVILPPAASIWIFAALMIPCYCMTLIAAGLVYTVMQAPLARMVASKPTASARKLVWQGSKRVAAA